MLAILNAPAIRISRHINWANSSSSIILSILGFWHPRKDHFRSYHLERSRKGQSPLWRSEIHSHKSQPCVGATLLMLLWFPFLHSLSYLFDVIEAAFTTTII